MSDPSGKHILELTPDDAAQELARLAKLIAKANDAYYNAAPLIDPQGHIVGKYLKTHLFDAPDRNQSTSSRRVSTVPIQALFMMNSEFVRKNAEAFAKRLDGERDPDKVRAAFELAYGRPATDPEVEASISYLTEFSGGGEISGEAWLSFCRTLMASNEFIYLD